MNVVYQKQFPLSFKELHYLILYRNLQVVSYPLQLNFFPLIKYVSSHGFCLKFTTKILALSSFFKNLETSSDICKKTSLLFFHQEQVPSLDKIFGPVPFLYSVYSEVGLFCSLREKEKQRIWTMQFLLSKSTSNAYLISVFS